ncbi:loganic acid O-methyltransferase-like [Cornus florida]|uniref:loganic acid O-methyltransferase-like n=1 Tax=Cornus florida TaxID=4283 RepID=UPI0028A235B9|nr:loganic acid O-methyltransferase-like [Cornus florida]
MDAIEVQYPMNGGQGPNSYVQNSSYQKGVVDAARDVIFQVVAEKLDLGNRCFDSSNPFRIADLGCSTGPNTFFAMQNVVEAVKLKYQSLPQTSPEFHVFFNDHTDNDFNVLFRSLPHNTGASPGYFAAGVPGSFYGRLFPKNTLHFLHSSYALQWLSKVPKEVLDRDSPAWNKGKIHYTGSDEHVTKAFFGQFQKDMDGFLKARAQEMVGGGLMLIQLPGIRNGGLFSQTGAGMIHFILGSCLVEMAKMGYTSEEKVDTYNVNQYHPSIEDLEMVVDMNKCFTIEKAGVLDHPMKHLPFDPKMTSAQERAIMEGSITKHFGNEIMDPLFDLYTQKLAENSYIFDKEVHKDVDLFIVLKRKEELF